MKKIAPFDHKKNWSSSNCYSSIWPQLDFLLSFDSPAKIFLDMVSLFQKLSVGNLLKNFIGFCADVMSFSILIAQAQPVFSKRGQAFFTFHIPSPV